MLDLESELVNRIVDAVYAGGFVNQFCGCDECKSRMAKVIQAELGKPLEKLKAIRELCQRHCHAGVNVGCHELASKVLAIIDGEQP